MGTAMANCSSLIDGWAIDVSHREENASLQDSIVHDLALIRIRRPQESVSKLL